MLVVGCVHGNECAAMVVRKLAGMRPGNEDLWLVPTLNPDGLAAGTRGNATESTSIDVPDGHEPETRAAVALIRRLRPDVTIWFHQPQGLVRAWGRSQAVARRYARLTRMRYGRVAWPTGSGDTLAEHGARRAELRRRATAGPARRA